MKIIVCGRGCFYSLFCMWHCTIPKFFIIIGEAVLTGIAASANV